MHFPCKSTVERHYHIYVNTHARACMLTTPYTIHKMKIQVNVESSETQYWKYVVEDEHRKPTRSLCFRLEKRGRCEQGKSQINQTKAHRIVNNSRLLKSKPAAQHCTKSVQIQNLADSMVGGHFEWLGGQLDRWIIKRFAYLFVALYFFLNICFHSLDSLEMNTIPM